MSIDERLAPALAEADVPSLLMVLVQLTGDRRWLESPYRPTPSNGMFADPGGGLDERDQDEVRAAALVAISAYLDGTPVAIPLPDDALFIEMMSTYVGEPVGAEYGPMVREEIGLVERDVEWRVPPGDRLERFHVAIIGAGLSGMCLAIQLRRLGIPFTILEKNPSVGGTWFENNYPGCRVDVPNHFYSYSFEPNPEWPENYSRRDQLLAYLERCATVYGLYEHVRFSTEVEAATYDEGEGVWRLDLHTPAGPETFTANVVVSAVGQLNRPKMPEIEGLDGFDGPVVHTGHWDPEIRLEGQRVAVVGTGASAMQLVPAIAPDVGQLLIFQRSPQWAVPNRDYHRSVSAEHRWIFANVPFYRSWYRFGLLWRLGDGILPALKRDPEWPDDGRSINAHNERIRVALTKHIKRQLGDRVDLIEKSVPEYPPYGKRLLIDNQWYETLLRSNVDLVVDPIARIEGDAVVTADGSRHEVDVVLCATGFNASHLLWPMAIRGRTGQLLSQVWDDDDPRAFLGIAMPGFPNLFFLYGPSTNLAHGGSIFFQAECQTRYIVSCLRELIEGDHVAMECREEPFLEYNDRLDAAVGEMVWAQADVSSWYLNSKRRVVANSPWRLVDYWSMTHDPDFDVWSFEPEHS